jgi:hypothetical protein
MSDLENDCWDAQLTTKRFSANKRWLEPLGVGWEWIGRFAFQLGCPLHYVIVMPLVRVDFRASTGQNRPPMGDQRRILWGSSAEF